MRQIEGNLSFTEAAGARGLSREREGPAAAFWGLMGQESRAESRHVTPGFWVYKSRN